MNVDPGTLSIRVSFTCINDRNEELPLLIFKAAELTVNVSEELESVANKPFLGNNPKGYESTVVRMFTCIPQARFYPEHHNFH